MKNITQIEKAILGNDNLDEHEKRYEERKQKTDRAKALLDDILSACEGGGFGNENADWATRGLLEILELFTFNKNSKVTPQDMAEDLQHHLFTWTFKHGDAYSQWRDDYFSGKWYAELNEEKESSDAPEAQTQTEQPKAKTLAEDTLQVIGENSDATGGGDLRSLASQISSVMKNEAMPTQLFNVMADEFSHTPIDWRSPENVLFNLKEMKKAEVKSE